MIGCTDAKFDDWKNGRTDRWREGWMNGQMDDGCRMDGWVNRPMIDMQMDQSRAMMLLWKLSGTPRSPDNPNRTLATWLSVSLCAKHVMNSSTRLLVAPVKRNETFSFLMLQTSNPWTVRCSGSLLKGTYLASSPAGLNHGYSSPQWLVSLLEAP